MESINEYAMPENPETHAMRPYGGADTDTKILRGNPGSMIISSATMYH